MPITLFMWILAVIPILVLLYLMIFKQFKANKAAPIGLLFALINATLFYKANLSLILNESLKGLWNSFNIIYVVFPAILLYELVNRAKAFDVFKNVLKKAVPNELIRILTISYVFVSFLQGITGFGVPVLVGAPLLISIGVSPFYAVVLPLLGHSWAGTFGTLAVAWDALVLNSGITGVLVTNAALWAGVFIWIFNFLAGIIQTIFYGGIKGLKKGFFAVFIISLIQGGGQLLLTQVNTTLAAFIPALISLVVILLISKLPIYKDKWQIDNSKVMNRDQEESIEEETNMNMHQAFSPFYLLSFISLFILLVSPIRNLLSQFKIGFSFSETKTGYGFINPAVLSYSPIAFLTHAGTFLFISAIFAFLFYNKNNWLEKNEFKNALRSTFKKTIPSAITVTSFIIMSRIMSGSGQTLVLAEGIANTLGIVYVILTPFVGLLGAFMTSSNMSSNILFAEFQLTIATKLNINEALILGAQTAGGSIGNAMTPGNIVLGVTTANIVGSEGKILKKMIPILLSIALFVGIILLILIII